jgi:O-acetylhomoserine (thiol)-lyase
VRNVYYPGSRPMRSTRSPHAFRAYGGLFAFELADGIDCFDFLNRLDIVVSSSNLGDNRTLAIPSRTRSSGRWGRAPRGDGHRRRR